MIIGWSYPRTARPSSTIITTLQACVSWGHAWLGIYLATWRCTWQTKPISWSPSFSCCKLDWKKKIFKKIMRNCSQTPLYCNLLPYYSRGGYLAASPPPVIDGITAFKSITSFTHAISQKCKENADTRLQTTAHPSYGTKYNRMPLLGNPTLLMFTHCKTHMLASPTSQQKHLANIIPHYNLFTSLPQH